MPSSTANSAATISVRETLALLNGPFSAVAEGVANAVYTLWLGSGISRGRVADLPSLIRRVLDFLQRRIDQTLPTCRFKKALENALALISLSAGDRATINFGASIDTWGARDTIVSALVGVYSKLLNVPVEGEKPDYLLWDAVDVRQTYANDGLKPDSEHLCVAILAMEGVAPNIASANWDGLIEIACEELSHGANNIIRVCVTGEDLRSPELQASLLKFHGCALKAKEDETTFRPLLIARYPQITNWMTDSEHAVIAHELISYLIKHPTLVMGLSTQDADIQYIFSKAQSMLKWKWPCNPPAYVFAEDDLGAEQLAVLQIGYGESDFNRDSPAIKDSALIRAYARQLLVALVLQVLFLKMSSLLNHGASPSLPELDRAELVGFLAELRDRAADAVAASHEETFVRSLVAHTGKLLSLFRSASAPSANRYYPVGHLPVGKITSDPSLSSSGLPELAIALALLQMGHNSGHWKVQLSAATPPRAAALSLALPRGALKVFLAGTSNIVMSLGVAGYLADDDPDTLVIVSAKLVPPVTRSPSASRGRTGRTGMRSVGISDLLSTVSSKDDLFQRFREELVP
jgi:hypothetical protein